MIASRSGASRLPRVIWRLTATRTMNALLSFLEENGFGDPAARREQIEAAVESLRYSPLRCAVFAVVDGLAIRRLIVDGRFFVYYVYFAPRGMSSGGRISVRAVKHAASQDPFLGVREALANDQPLCALSTRDNVEPAIATA
jgi:hypothetical protein